LRRLHLAVFNYNLPVDGQKRGGVDRVAHTLAHALARRGHEVTVFTHDSKPRGAAYDVRPLPWKVFVDTWFGRRATMGYLGNLLAVLPDYRGFDVVIMHGDSLLAPLCGKPVLRVMHGSAWGEARHATSLGRTILQSGVYLQELLTACCQSPVVAVSECTRRANPFIRYVIPHGVDSDIFTPTPDERSVEPSILFVGTLDGRKRGRLLLDGFLRSIRAQYPDATLTIVGPAGENHPGVRYYTGVSDADLAALYRRSWVYASPSSYEGFGLPYLEAMSCGTPVVASPNPGSLEVLGGGAGLLAADAEFVEAVADLLRNKTRRETLRLAGLARAQMYSLATMVDRYEQLLFEMAAFDAGSVAAA